MHLSRKITKVISVAAFLGMLVTSATAGQNGNRTGAKDGTHDQDRSREKSCTLNTAAETGLLLLAKQNGNRGGAKDGTRDQDRSREKSCTLNTTAETGLSVDSQTKWKQGWRSGRHS